MSTGNGHRTGDGHRTETPDVSHIRNVEVTHETSDVNTRGVLTFVVVLSLIMAASSLGLWFLFNYLNTKKGRERPPGPLAIRNLKQEDRLPPAPRLQGSKGFEVTLESGQKVKLELTHPQAEYDVLRQQWLNALQTGVKDSSGNTVGMPIEDAIKKVVSGEGLPVRTKQAPGKLENYAIGIPSDMSSGRETVKLR
jgi:hypothetical protein